MTRAVIVAFLLAVVTPATYAQTAAISGRVLDDADQPVAAARVSAASRSARTARSVLTGSDGRYALTGLPAGTYTLTAERAGHESRRYGQTAHNGPGTPITVGDADRQVADLRLPRLGAISGVVVDEHGVPFPGGIFASQYVERDGVRALRPSVVTLADRYGRYRMTDLVAGEYIVELHGRGVTTGREDLRPMTPDFIARARAAAQNPIAPLPVEPEYAGSASYVSSYYPGVTSPGAAVPVMVEPGRERTGIDMRLMLVPTTRVEGRVMTADGSPASHTMVAVVGLGNESPARVVGSTGVDGRFSFGTVPHGSYLVTTGTASTPVEATGSIVRGITLTLPEDLTISGRVAYPSALEPSPRLGVQVRLIPTNASYVTGVAAPRHVFRVGADGRFEGSVAPGAYRADVSTAGLPDGWTVESVRVRDNDLLDLPLTILEPIGDVVVTIASQRTEIAGVLRHPDGTPEPGVLMIAFASDRRYWTAGSRRTRAVRPDPAGRYTFGGLPPGDYLVAAVTEFDTGGGIGPDVLEPLVAAGTAVSLERGERRRLDFTVGGGR